MEPSKRLAASLLCWVVIFASSAQTGAHSSTQCHFPAIFNFGDSNSDTGGLSAAFGQAPPPNGESFFHHPAGRYSDGRLVIDFAAQSFGLPYLSAYLDSVGTNFSHGANFATAGSTIRPQNTTLTQTGYSPISLDVQLFQFEQFKSRSGYFRQQGGVFEELLPKQSYFSEALYTFDIGQNDLTAGLFQNLTVEQVKASVPDILEKFSTAIKNVYWQGGRYFWIHNTGPVGCLAYVIDRLPILVPQVDMAGCATPFNHLAQYFNQLLKETVIQLRSDLPDATFTYVDVYSVKYQLISGARKYGFGNPLRACCGHGGKYNYNRYFGCGSAIYKDGQKVVIGKSCNNPSKAIIWDGVHYTQAANQWVFNKIVDGTFSDPPTPLSQACHGHKQ
ncbi:GDSL esterase/lipase At3g26430 [Amborella trichopoda]|uniref:Alpha-L-fucosidase n=1 Tax=Amborella trichopoda TaxID=13333 RepID=W1PUZ9_AMBTC|nr:GDSL esterase/lipase At3g26430 [Amborella trichopoda]ERN13847.1 hypothetical protein AMTR_s00049p00229270 [Amborella trichopoda]|eukprot:XP_006852380.1 GDSL esterase/lipase At3g26430 [Amborella trichopoda]